MVQLLVVYPRMMDAMLPAMDRLSQGQTQRVKLAMTAAPIARAVGGGGSVTGVQDKVVAEKKKVLGRLGTMENNGVQTERWCGFTGICRQRAEG